MLPKQNEASISPKFIKEWADRIKQMRLTMLAILLLEAHKPLSFVAGQFIILGQPMLNLFVPPPFPANVVSLFSNRAYLERLIKELEQD